MFASPIAADGNVYFSTEAGAVVVVEPGSDLSVKQVNDLGEEVYATPAVAYGRIYLSTEAGLFSLGDPKKPFQVTS